MRSIQDIRDNLDFVGCHDVTVLQSCDEIDRLRQNEHDLRTALLETYRDAVSAITGEPVADCERGFDEIIATIHTAIEVLQQRLIEATCRRCERDISEGHDRG